MKRWGIVGRALFLGLIPAAVVAALLSIYFYNSRLADLQTAIELRAASVARHLVLAVEQPLALGDVARLQLLVTLASQDPDVSAITLSGADGRVLAKAVNTQAGGLPVGDTKMFSIRQTIPSELKPEVGSKSAGMVEVTVANGAATQVVKQILTRSIGVALLVLALAAMLALRLAYDFVNPIRKLAEAAKALAAGNLGTRVALNSNGELRALEECVNNMAAALQSAQENLERQIQTVSAEMALRAGAEARALTSQKEAAEAANRAKSRFLAAATHDLRQPLHALGLFSGALLEKIRYPEVRELVVNINKSVEALDGLFNSLLDISKLDAGVIEPARAPFALQTLFDKLMRDYQHQALSKGIVFRLRPSTHVVYSDAALVERIMRNLVSNAVALTGHNGVLVGARKRGDQVRIEVWDCGPGIEAANLKDIFQEFYQLGNPERDRSKGLGLGLAIVQRLARLLDTKVNVRSKVGRGSMFSFELPLTQIQPQPEVSYTTPALNNLIGAFIVIIDDERAVLEGMRALLTDWGCRLILADSVTDALNKLKGESVPDLLIADYRLREGATGIQALARLQKEYGLGIPGILITGDTSPDRLREAKASGYYILHKPVRAPKLRTLLSYALEQYKKVTRPNGL